MTLAPQCFWLPVVLPCLVLEVGAQRVINVSSDFSQTSSGDLAFMLNSDSQFGQMDFTGTVTLDGKVNAAVLVGYAPAQGTEWDIMNFTQGYLGTLTAPTGYTLIYNTGSIDLELTTAPHGEEPAPTPEPKPVLVLAAGGLCVFFKRRRQRIAAV